MKLKADRPHPRDYSTHKQTPWTDNDSSLLFAALGKVVTEGQTDGRTGGWTEGCYQVHYLPPASLSYAVDKYGLI